MRQQERWLQMSIEHMDLGKCEGCRGPVGDLSETCRRPIGEPRRNVHLISPAVRHSRWQLSHLKMSRTITATKEQAERGNARDSDEELLDFSSGADENGRPDNVKAGAVIGGIINWML